MKHLLLMRHAKSDWSADHATDHDRPLNERGVRSARVMGRVLSEQGHVPELVLTSSALRARTTAQLAAEAGEWACDVVTDSRLYGSSAEDVIQVVAGVRDPGRLLLVGHQPTWSILVSRLTGENVDMRTATVAVLGFDLAAWSDLPGATGEIERVYQPRDYTQ